MIINNNSVEQINIAFLDLEKKLLTIKDDKSVIDSLRNSINAIKASLNETKAGLTSGATYDINITGNATTATTATTAGSAVSAESAERATTAERASKDGNGNSITSTYATKEELANTNNELKSVVPVGIILPYGGINAPDGYLLCDGREVSRIEYSALFKVIGTSFGNGNGTDTFNVPDMRESVPVGIDASGRADNGDHDIYTLGQFKKDQMQSHTHIVKQSVGFQVSGVGYAVSSLGNNEVTTTGASGRTGTTTHGKQVGVNYIIKY